MKKRILSFFLAAIMIFSLCAVGVPYVMAADMKTSEKGISLIKDFEGFSAKPFYDYGQYSVGYGTACKYSDYKNGITKDQADKLLREKLAEFEADLNEFAKDNGLTLSQQQFDALISFTYNVGTGWMNSSALKTAMVQNAKGNEIINAMSIWCNAGGSVMEGLLQRRLAEANLYLNGIYSKNHPSNYRYIIFDNNIESAISTVKVQGYDANQTDVLRAAPSKAGYRFLGWYTEAKGGEWLTKADQNTPKKLYAHWQPVGSVDLGSCAANYVRYAGDKQVVYTAPGGSQVKTLKAGTKLTILADYIDNDGLKWGKISEGNWVKLSETKDAETTVQGQAVNVKVTVSTNGVNIRKGPGTSYPKAGTANKGQQLQLTRVQQGGMYLWGQFSGGWICLDYTDYEMALLNSSANADKVTATGVVINADKLNIRAYPGTGSAKVGTYSRGDKVEITLQHKVGGATWGKTDKGWISLYYVKLTPVTENTEPDTTTPTEPTTPTTPDTPTTPTTPTDPDTSTTPSTPSTPSTSDKTEVIATGKIVDCTSLRIRAGAGTKYPQTGSLAKGTKVSLYEMVVVGSQIWGRIDKGWICMTYVELDRVNPDGTSTSGTIVNCTSLNVRAGAGTMYAKVGSLARGTKVDILETAQVGNVTWGRISKGWISLYYVKLDGKLPENLGTTQKPSEDTTVTPTEPADKDDTGTGDNAQQGTTTPEVTDKTVKTGVVTGAAQVRLRQSPSTDSKQVGTVKQGDRIVILETVKNGNATWGKTEDGWIHMFYVKLSSEQVPEGSIVRTVTTTLRIRAGAGTNYEAVGTYLRGAQVVITAQTTVNGATWGRTDKGWIHMFYVK